jgi:hypothetical protein
MGMKQRSKVSVLALTAAMALGTTMSVSPASAAGGNDVRVIAGGLVSPFGLDAIDGYGFLTAESFAGRVTRVGPLGKHHTIIDNAAGVSGVAASPDHAFAVLGGPDEFGAPQQGDYPVTSVLRARWDGTHVKVLANLQRYELNHNPDGQVQFVKGVPPDTLSNPFSMSLSKYGLLVADGGANDVLKIDPSTGHVSTFFVPPTVKNIKACLSPKAQANPGTVGCDPVPTGIAVARGSIWVSTLGAEVPGAGRVYELNPWTGKVRNVYGGLTAPTGIAVAPNGAIYVSEVLFGAPEGDGPPPPGFDPSKVGRITKIFNGTRTHAQVTMPTGMDFQDGALFSTAWSVGPFFGVDHPGQIVKVKQSAFKP